MNSKSRHIVIIVLSLCFTRVAMDTLGHPDYGICMLMSGIVSLLICVRSSLMAAVVHPPFMMRAAGRFLK